MKPSGTPAADIPRRSVGAVALLVRDCQEAIDYFVGTLGFTLIEDTTLSEGKRWVLVSPGAGTPLLLAEANGERQRAAIGSQSGGRVFLFLTTDDFWRDYRHYMSRGVEFEEEPRHEAYGTVAVFTDRYGNRWDLIEPSSS
ncbi:MAG: VOC family protein [Boseongicola sp.]|nr:VOC family protein [Boseongicola sp.]